MTENSNPTNMTNRFCSLHPCLSAKSVVKAFLLISDLVSRKRFANMGHPSRGGLGKPIRVCAFQIPNQKSMRSTHISPLKPTYSHLFFPNTSPSHSSRPGQSKIANQRSKMPEGRSTYFHVIPPISTYFFSRLSTLNSMSRVAVINEIRIRH
jgi:hypothetical protein